MTLDVTTAGGRLITFDHKLQLSYDRRLEKRVVLDQKSAKVF